MYTLIIISLLGDFRMFVQRRSQHGLKSNYHECTKKKRHRLGKKPCAGICQTDISRLSALQWNDDVFIGHVIPDCNTVSQEAPFPIPATANESSGSPEIKVRVGQLDMLGYTWLHLEETIVCTSKRILILTMSGKFKACTE